MKVKRRRVIIAAAAVTVAFAAIVVTDSLDGQDRPHGQGTAVGSAAGTANLGVFEPLRGRIVYVAGRELRGIDPADPPSVYTLALPSGVESTPVVSGWSADGTRLALTDEKNGKTYVMAADGTVSRARDLPGCCLFVSDPWLSPDGGTAIELVTAERLHLRDLEDRDASRVIEFEQPISHLDAWYVPVHAWSPDGARIAITVDRRVDNDLAPSVYIVDLDIGTTRELAGLEFGHIRHMTWSPDGSRLLLVASPLRLSTITTPANPLTEPLSAGLYLVDPDSPPPSGSATTPQRIAQGHYVAATWSPDGDRIAAIDFSPWSRRIVSMRIDGSGLQILLDRLGSGLFTGLAWHPTPDDR